MIFLANGNDMKVRVAIIMSDKEFKGHKDKGHYIILS